eukprot:403340808
MQDNDTKNKQNSNSKLIPEQTQLIHDQVDNDVQNFKTIDNDYNDIDHSNLNQNSKMVQNFKSSAPHNQDFFEEVSNSKQIMENNKKPKLQNFVNDSQNSKTDAASLAHDEEIIKTKTKMAKKETSQEGSIRDKGGPGDKELNQSQGSDSLQNLLGQSHNSKNMKDFEQLTNIKSYKIERQEIDEPDQIKQNLNSRQEVTDLLPDINKSDKMLDSGQTQRSNRNSSDLLLIDTHLPMFKQQDANSNQAINIDHSKAQQASETNSVKENIEFKGTNIPQKEQFIDNQVSKDEDGYYLSESSEEVEISSRDRTIHMGKKKKKKLVIKSGVEMIKKAGKLHTIQIRAEVPKEQVKVKMPRYRDRDYQPKQQKELDKIYEQQREEVTSNSNFFDEMQKANSFFNDQGFMKFQCDSRKVKLEEKDFYYVFDNKLFVLMRKKKKNLKIMTQLNVETQSIFIQESIPESENRLQNVKNGDKNHKDDGNDLNFMFLEMIGQGKYYPLYFQAQQEDKYIKCEKYLSIQNFDKNIDQQIQDSNYVISIYQMPELSHIKDVETGLQEVSKKTKLFKEINRNIFLINTQNKDFDSEYDRIIGLTTKLSFKSDAKQIMIFMKKNHVLFETHGSFTNQNNYCFLNKLKVDNSDIFKEVTLTKVYCCEGNVGLGVHFDENDKIEQKKSAEKECKSSLHNANKEEKQQQRQLL